MDFDNEFFRSESPQTNGNRTFLMLLRGQLEKPSVNKIMHVYAQEFMPLIEYARGTLGAPAGEELEYITAALQHLPKNDLKFRIKAAILNNRETRYPDFWRVGDLVQFVRTDEYGYKVAGQYARICELDKSGIPASRYQVFWTNLCDSSGNIKLNSGTFWTTPEDVMFIKRGDE